MLAVVRRSARASTPSAAIIGIDHISRSFCVEKTSYSQQWRTSKPWARAQGP